MPRRNISIIQRYVVAVGGNDKRHFLRRGLPVRPVRPPHRRLKSLWQSADPPPAVLLAASPAAVSGAAAGARGFATAASAHQRTRSRKRSPETEGQSGAAAFGGLPRPRRVPSDDRF